MAIDDLVAESSGQEDSDLGDRCPSCGAQGVEPEEPERGPELKCPTDPNECGVLYWFPS